MRRIEIQKISRSRRDEDFKKSSPSCNGKKIKLARLLSGRLS